MRSSFAIIFSFLIFISCEIINPDEEIPGYIKIDKIDLDSDHNKNGITDAWIYIDGNLQGVYELPTKFPILEKGTREIEILGGIKVNGIAASRTWYPFFTAFTVGETITELDTITIHPVLSYNSDVYFMWEENFEGLVASLDTAPASDTNIVFSNDAYSGNASGAIYLDPGDVYFEAITSNNFPDLTNTLGKPVFMEMHYKNDLEFFFGMYVIRESDLDIHPIMGINKSEEWNKIYIDLSSSIDDYHDARSFYYYFIAYKNAEDSTKSTILLDNLRIVLSRQ